jgi:dTDP-glucose 4,6-dehydratase
LAILVTGGAGFIGSNFVLDWLRLGLGPVVNVDKLTYAGNLQNLASIADEPTHQFVRADIGDRDTIRRLLDEHGVTAIVNFAAETHVIPAHERTGYVRVAGSGKDLLRHAGRKCEKIVSLH